MRKSKLQLLVMMACLLFGSFIAGANQKNPEAVKGFSGTVEGKVIWKQKDNNFVVIEATKFIPDAESKAKDIKSLVGKKVTIRVRWKGWKKPVVAFDEDKALIKKMEKDQIVKVHVKNVRKDNLDLTKQNPVK